MRFLSAVLALLIVLAIPAYAQDSTPSLDEYNNVKPGLLMPAATENNAGAPEEAQPQEETPGETQQAMTIEDIVAAYQQGKFDLAAKLLLPLAKNGQHQAEELIGIMYRTGQGVPKDPAQALVWLSKAAEANRPLAQHHLASIYYAGEGVTADPVKSLMWLHIAILHYPDGPEKKRAIEDRENVYAQLSRRDKERALELAREWLDKKDEGHLLDMQQ
jgi:TPR repeat protein